jgi:hypothetical protein
MIMGYLSIGLFAIAALGGLTLAIMKFAGRGLPMPLAIGHGILAAAGLVTVIIMVVQSRVNTMMNISLLLFFIVAIGGFILFSLHVMKKGQPNMLIAVHGLGAIISFVILLIALLR